MKRRKKRSSQIVGRRLAAVVFLDVTLAVAEHDGQLDIVRLYPDGSAESVSVLDTPGASPDHCLCLLRDAVEMAYGMVKEQERLRRFRRDNIEPLQCPFDDLDPPYRPFGPHENN